VHVRVRVRVCVGVCAWMGVRVGGWVSVRKRASAGASVNVHVMCVWCVRVCFQLKM